MRNANVPIQDSFRISSGVAQSPTETWVLFVGVSCLFHVLSLLSCWRYQFTRYSWHFMSIISTQSTFFSWLSCLNLNPWKRKQTWFEILGARMNYAAYKTGPPWTRKLHIHYPCLQAVRRRISLRMCDISREPLALYTAPSSLYQFSLL